eukprot:30694-Pelagococcus_subviridis.AAC.10
MVTMFGCPDSCCIKTSSFVTSSMDIDAVLCVFQPSLPSLFWLLVSSLSASSLLPVDIPHSLPLSSFTRNVFTANVSPETMWMASRTTAKPPVPTGSPSR